MSSCFSGRGAPVCAPLFGRHIGFALKGSSQEGLPLRICACNLSFHEGCRHHQDILRLLRIKKKAAFFRVEDGFSL